LGRYEAGERVRALSSQLLVENKHGGRGVPLDAFRVKPLTVVTEWYRNVEVGDGDQITVDIASARCQCTHDAQNIATPLNRMVPPAVSSPS
jgi:hypothetical protein